METCPNCGTNVADPIDAVSGIHGRRPIMRAYWECPACGDEWETTVPNEFFLRYAVDIEARKGAAWLGRWVRCWANGRSQWDQTTSRASEEFLRAVQVAWNEVFNEE